MRFLRNLSNPGAGLFGLAILALLAAPASGGDWPQWCGRPDRNMVSDEKGLPDRFDEVTGKKTTGLANVKWAARLGIATFGSPVVSGGKVFVGGAEGLFSHSDTLAVLWCLRESDGKLLWRLRLPFRPGAINRSFGITSTPTIDGDRVWLETPNGEVVCLSADGLAGGNRGPFTDEANYFATGRKLLKNEIAPDGRRIIEWTPGTPAALGPIDADVLWRFDLLSEVNAWPFNACNAAPLLLGDRLYVGTCSTLSAHSDGSIAVIDPWKKAQNRKTYDSPDLIVLDRNTGKLLAVEKEGIFDRTFHGSHSTPALGKVNGRDLIVFGGGDGTCYAFDADFAPGAEGAPGALKLVWKFNALDPAHYDPGFFARKLDRAETVASPVFYGNRVYLSLGNDLIKSGRRAGPGRLVCIDATKTGDISGAGIVWSFDKIHSSASTVAVADGLVYAADAAGSVWCLDAETGKLYWSHDTADVWSSPLAADGKVFVPTHGRGLLVLAQGKNKKVLTEAGGDEEFVASPAAANGTLFLASQKYLYAVQKGASGSVVDR